MATAKKPKSTYPHLHVQVEPKLFDRLEKYLATESLRPSRKGVIEAALREFLDSREKKSDNA